MNRTVFSRLLFAACLFLQCGTTYIVKEKGVEVGRWEDADGKNDVKVIENELPPPVPKPIDNNTPYSVDAGYTREPAKIPEGKIKQWKVSGRVIDTITLAPVGGGKLTFSGGGQNIEAKVLSMGAFSASLPALTSGGYFINYSPAKGYDSRIEIFKGQSLANIPYARRLTMRDSVRFTGDFGSIMGTTYDMQIGVFSLARSQKEKEDYQTLVLNPGADSGNS